MGEQDRELIRLEKEREFFQNELNEQKDKFAKLIKQRGEILKDPETFIKRPSKWKIIKNRLKDILTRIDSQI